MNITILSSFPILLINKFLNKHLIQILSFRSKQPQELIHKEEQLNQKINSKTTYLKLNIPTNYSFTGLNLDRSIGIIAGYLPKLFKNGIEIQKNSIYYQLLISSIIFNFLLMIV